MTSEQTGLPARAWYRNRRRWIIAASVLFLALLVLISLPYGIQYGLSDFLKQHGARQVLIRNIDFNPFTGRLLFEGVTALAEQEQPLRLQRLELVLGWRELFAKRARVEAVELEGLVALLDLSDPDRLRVNGLDFPLAAAAAPAPPPGDAQPWGFALDQVELRASTLSVRRNDLTLDLELQRLSLQRVISWQLQEVADFSLEARINNAPISVELRASLFDETPAIEGEIDLQGLDLGRLQPLLNGVGGPKLGGRLGLQQDFKLGLSPDQAVSWELEGALLGGDLQVFIGQLEVRDRAAHWQGRSSGSWSGAQGLGLHLAGELKLDGLALSRHRLQTDLAALQWQGEVSLAPGEASPELSVAGEAALEGLHLADREGGDRLVALQRLGLSGLSLTPDNRLTLAAVNLQGIRLDLPAQARQDPLLQTQTLAFKDVRYGAASGLRIGLVEQQGMQARLALDRAGRLNLLGLAERLQQAALPADTEDRPAAAETQAAPLRIDRLVWQGENRASFTDNSVQPPFQLSLDVKGLSVRDIDSTQPARPSPFRFVGSTGRHAQIIAEGEITLFQGAPTGKIEGRLQGVELLPLSSYTVPAIGYHLDSGELDAEVRLALQQGTLQGENHLVIRRLEVSRANEAGAAKLDAQIAMPLDTALGMLQDDHQTIDLNLPVSGKLDDPDLALGDVINTALGHALKKGAMTYLTTALFPYGTMVALLKMAGEEAAAVRLDPVEFEAAAELLDDQDRDYLGKVAQVLKERPKITVRLCGVATGRDRQELARISAAGAEQERQKEGSGENQAAEAPPPPEISEEELLALAQRRAEVIEDYLVERHGISPSRTALCRPVIDPGEGGLPRVDLQI